MSDGWVTVGSDWHCMPANDLRDHSASKACWCKPVAGEDYNDNRHPTVWMHNSADGRENVPKVKQ